MVQFGKWLSRGWLALMVGAVVGLAGTAQAWQDDAERPTEVQIRRELNRRLSDEQLGLDSAVNYLDSVLDQVPPDSDLRLIAVSLNASRGARFLSEEKRAEALGAMTRAGQLAEAVIAQARPLLAAEREMLGDVFFFLAQAHAAVEEYPQMYQALDQAFELGFERLSLLQEAKPFSALQSDDTFRQYQERQRALIPQRVAAQLRQEFEAFQSFPFDFDVVSVTGERLAKSELAGKILVVDVWGTWCPPCRQELPHFVALQQKFGDQGVQVVGLNSENDETEEQQKARVLAAIREFKINYPCGLIDDDFLRTIPDFEGFPTTLFLDSRGQVRLKMVGVQSESRLEVAVQFLLDEAKRANR